MKLLVISFAYVCSIYNVPFHKCFHTLWYH